MENQENKLSQDQLEELQGYVGKLNSAASQIGNLELQKHQLKHSAAEVQQELNKLQTKLEEKYGKIKIDIQTGVYEAIPEDEAGEEVVGPEVLKKA
jgi:predicted nuclease with TOPRIM domain|tara:strand:+ start:342 stop:629 length:288 start_codon:yes stop_codon:yes gene_type:complete